MTALRYRVAMRMENAGRWRFRERFTGIDLGRACWDQNERMWHIAWLMNPAREGISRLPTLDGVALELERWCNTNPDEVSRLHRALLAARDRATSPEPVSPAPVRDLQGAMGI